MDSVEILMMWENSLGVTITDAEAEELRTPCQAIDLLVGKLDADESQVGKCLGMRAFNLLRKTFIEVASVQRSAVRPETSLRKLVSENRNAAWAEIRNASGISSLPKPGWLSSETVGSLSRWILANAAFHLKHPQERWTRRQIRAVVRVAVSEISGLDHFSDDDDFIRDLKLD